MNPEQTPQVSVSKPKNVTSTIALIGVLLIAGAVTWLAIQVNSLATKVEKQADTQNAEEQAAATVSEVNLTSGKNGFTMRVPNGWGPLIKDTESDSFILVGTQQPTVKAGAKTEVTETKGYGSDNASVFMVMLSDEGGAPDTRGTAAEFTIGKGDDALVGTKYSYIYPKDDLDGIGYLRSQNDRNYHYTFTTKNGKKLDVFYGVYGSDPRNQIETVDEIVRSIIIK